MAFPTVAGFKELVQMAIGAASDAWTHIAVGTGTGQSASSTTLAAESSSLGMSRAAATMSAVTTTETNDTVQATKTFTATGTVTITEAGLFNNATLDTGDMLMYGELSPSAAMVNGDTLAITLKVQIKAAA